MRAVNARVVGYSQIPWSQVITPMIINDSKMEGSIQLYGRVIGIGFDGGSGSNGGGGGLSLGFEQ